MSSDPAWDYYRTFLYVLRNGSLSAAARELRLTQPTVGRQIAALEKSLGGKALFTRSPSGLLPTRTALELQSHAETMAATAAMMLRASAGAGPIDGTVQSNPPATLRGAGLPRRLRALSCAHP